MNSIHPTFTRSATADEAAIAAGTTLDEWAGGTPKGRLADVQDVANIAVFLASAESS
ncbi:SDR family oxidoreductase [Rhodococcus sp. NPDC059968]|uniref:SDR family oxidoreductase n=1 Tax=Rhodococcus sp. NPDC059968 TaxID=3347017 RepID=UPI00366D5C8B